MISDDCAWNLHEYCSPCDCKCHVLRNEMETIWNAEGITITAVVSAKYDKMLLIVTGVGRNKERMFEYQAIATQHGWMVTIITSAGRIGEYQGQTFNLPLEIATAARRLM